MGNANSSKGRKSGEAKKRKSPHHKVPALFGKKRVKRDIAQQLPAITPISKCRLRLLRLEHVKDHLVMEEEFLRNIQSLTDVNQNHSSMEETHTTLDKMRGYPMRVVKLVEIIDDNHAVVSSIVGDTYLPILSFVDKGRLEPGCNVLVTYNISALVGVLGDNVDATLSRLEMESAPDETYADVGGLTEQIEEIKECMEIPLTRPDLYEDMGIQPPKGAILYGPPGTGKTLLVKAVANATSATFLRIVGSELVKKELGEGPRLVREIFRIAEEHAPTILFIDEIDAIGSKRYDGATDGQKEVQRTMIELLTQLDGFDSHRGVRVIMATNRIDMLDPALIRPGRIDRKVEFSLPDKASIKKIFQIHTKLMTLAADVNADDLINGKDDLSGADIRAMCTEAGLLALRERRTQVKMEDFVTARNKVLYQKLENFPEVMYL